MSAPNLLLGPRNLVDLVGVSLTSDDEDPDYPTTNLLLPSMGRVHRTESASLLTYTLLLADAITLSRFAVVLAKVNYTDSASIQVTFKNGGVNQMAPQTFDANQYGWWPAPIDGQHRNNPLYYYDSAHHGGNDLTIDEIVIIVDDSTNPYGYLEAARLWVSALDGPVIGLEYDWDMRWMDPSNIDTTPGGNDTTQRQRKYRQGNFSLKNLDQAEAWDQLFAGVDAVLGKTGDCLVMPFPPDDFVNLADTLHYRLLLGRQLDISPVAAVQFMSDRYAKPVAFRERT